MISINPKIFREYDIRGFADVDLTDAVVELIGRAYGTYMKRAGACTVTVGRDVRLSSPRIHKSLAKGIRSTGLNVIDVGQVPTPVLYFSIIHFGADGGAMVTGSHNPIEYNGLKLCKGIESIYGKKIQGLRRMVEERDFTRGDGSLAPQSPVEAYVKAIKDRIHIKKSLKVVIDAGNGSVGEIVPGLFTDLGCDVIPLFCDVDGSFPNHLPDPTIPRYMEDLKKKVRETKADLGIGYDGDGDRIGVVDGRGEIIYADKLLALFARDVLRRRPGSTIILDVKCSQGLVEDIEAHGGRPLMWKTGHSLIKSKMKQEDAPLAGEMSGHMFFADDYFGYDDAIYASGRLLQLLSEEEASLSEIVATVPGYYSTPEIRIECTDKDKFRIVKELKDYFRSRYDVIDIDGVRVLFGDGWGLVRASNTQPILVLRFEAKTEEHLHQIQRIVIDRLRAYPAVQLGDLA